MCVATACDPGFYIPTDTNRVCVPSSGAKDCTPCADDAQCSELVGGKCTDIDGGRFCTASCGPGVNCAAGYACDEGQRLECFGIQRVPRTAVVIVSMARGFRACRDLARIIYRRA